MAYNKQSIRILTGGLNLLAPGDVIGDDDAQELTNWHTDSQGALRSRRGHTVRYSVGGAAVNATRGLGGLLIAAGGSVYKDGAAIIGGVSSDLCGLVAYKDFAWAMSAADQRKSDGSSDWQWIPDAPATAPTAKAAATVETPVVDFAGGWTVDPDTDVNYNDGVLTMHPTQEAEYSATKDAALDLYTGYSVDDVFQVTLWCKQWKKVNTVTFQLDCGDGSFGVDYYTAEMKKAEINAGAKEEVTFYLRKRPLEVDTAAQDKKRYAAFARIGSTPDKDYRSIVKARIKLDLSDATKFRFHKWVLIGNNENTLEGDDFRVYYTYTTAAGHESNPSPPSEPITLNRSGIVVTGMAASGDAQVTGQNVYVSGGTLAHVYRANGNTPVSGSSYTVTATDDDLTNDNLQLEDDHDQPPAVGGLAGPFYGRLLAFGGSKVYYSHIDKPYAFGGAELLDGDWTGVDAAAGDLIQATIRPGMIWIYGTHGVIVGQGDLGDLSSALHCSAVKMGIQSPQGVAQSSQGDFVNMHKGLYLFTGDSAQLLSKKIQSVFDGFNAENAAVGVFNNVVWVSDGSVTYKLDLLTDRWFRDSRTFSLFIPDGTTFVGVTTGGQVLNLDTGTSDGGSAIDVAFTSKDFDAGLHSDEKRWGDFECWANTGGATLTVSAILSEPDQTIALGTMTSSGEERFVFAFSADGEGVDARRCRIRITGNVSAEALVHSMELWYYPKARQGKSFDTGEQHFGEHRVKLFREIILDLDNQAEVGITVKTDRPQPMADRSTALTVATTSDRRMQPVILPAGIIGRLFRLVLHGSDFRSYGGKVLMQVYGTYLEGEEDEFYSSDVLDFGSERVKLLKEIECVYQAEGEATLTVSSDLPGDALVVRATYNLPTTTGEESIKLRVPADVKGRLWQVDITPTGTLRLEAIRFFMKFIGSPNSTSWDWIPLPVQSTSDAVWVDVSVPPDDLG